MAPFELPWGLPETDIAQKLFERFRELHGVFARSTADEMLKKQEELNRKRTVRVFEKGEVVFRKLPSFARPAKHLLGDRCTGPFVVVDQRSLQSAVLKDPSTGELVDHGRSIPLDQLLAGPRRSKLALDEPAEVRGIGDMLRGREGAASWANRIVASRSWAKERMEYFGFRQLRGVSDGSCGSCGEGLDSG